MLSFFRPLLLGLLLGGGLLRAESIAGQPWAANALSMETGLLWQIGTGTPIAYRLVPTQLAWRSPAVLRHEFAAGSQLVVRHRLGLIGTWVQEGPESLYLGITASPSIEWWNATGSWGLFGGSGGGLGVIDSRGTPGGQGQDFTLNWFIRGGVERMISPQSSISLGILYKHLSNGGQTDPNPGIDALGFSIGFSKSY